MNSIIARGLAAALLAAAVTVPAASQAQAPTAPSAPYVAADVNFMTGMIGHHAQAILISRWAPSHGASETIRTLTERIVVGQGDEIALMSRWLRDRNLPVPDTSASRMPSMAGMAGMDHSTMPGMDHSTMPGMLSAAQLAQLDSARGPAFDRMFMTFMIQHHQGALTMVDELFGSQGAAQNETVFRLASDIYADQSTEIARMQKMIAALPPAPPSH